ncbi:alpha/beta hydrolase [Candidatus Gottesmanbacteria bacterium]|nr:alpha/beta hydrolase [Candidatus Gottesmanbacteria bacterium]
MNKNKFDICLIIHGCPASADRIIPKKDRWMNWLETELKILGYKAYALDMPTPWNPIYSKWKSEFEKYPITENSVLVGHSCGAAFLVRYLLESGKKVKKLVLVAPVKIPETENDTRKGLYEFSFKTKSY